MTNMQSEHSKHGTHIGPDDSALIVGANGEFRLCMPDYEDGKDVPFQAAIIMAIWLKLRNDETWAGRIVEEAFADD